MLCPHESAWQAVGGSMVVLKPTSVCLACPTNSLETIASQAVRKRRPIDGARPYPACTEASCVPSFLLIGSQASCWTRKWDVHTNDQKIRHTRRERERERERFYHGVFLIQKKSWCFFNSKKIMVSFWCQRSVTFFPFLCTLLCMTMMIT